MLSQSGNLIGLPQLTHEGDFARSEKVFEPFFVVMRNDFRLGSTQERCRLLLGDLGNRARLGHCNAANVGLELAKPGCRKRLLFGHGWKLNDDGTLDGISSIWKSPRRQVIEPLNHSLRSNARQNSKDPASWAPIRHLLLMPA
jgi:hypothetical protein